MKPQIGIFVFTSALISMGGVGLVALAQGGDASDAAAADPAAMSGQAQLVEAARIQEKVTAVRTAVDGMIEEARESGDILRVTCLTDKLTQLSAHDDMVAERSSSLAGAVEGGEAELAVHELTVIQVVEQKVDVLEGEASACIGEDLFHTGDTVVDMDVDPETPDENLTDSPFGDLPGFVDIPPPGVLLPPRVTGII